MARIKQITRIVTMCGSCGKILPNDIEVFEKCPKCKVIIEA